MRRTFTERTHWHITDRFFSCALACPLSSSFFALCCGCGALTSCINTVPFDDGVRVRVRVGIGGKSGTALGAGCYVIEDTRRQVDALFAFLFVSLSPLRLSFPTWRSALMLFPLEFEESCKQGSRRIRNFRTFSPLFYSRRRNFVFRESADRRKGKELCMTGYLLLTDRLQVTRRTRTPRAV